ncbi:hypothetical protein SNEBB_010547 [Seison nebaliae]|nr:hypothetical protein SNEBB_010547 [Seison nebaliae]
MFNFFRAIGTEGDLEAPDEGNGNSERNDNGQSHGSRISSSFIVAEKYEKSLSDALQNPDADKIDDCNTQCAKLVDRHNALVAEVRLLRAREKDRADGAQTIKSELTSRFMGEIHCTKLMADELANDKAKLTLENEELLRKQDELEETNRDLEQRNRMLVDKLEVSERKTKSFEMKLNVLNSEKEHWEDQKSQIDRLNEELLSERHKKVVAENALVSMREEINLLKDTNEISLTEMNRSTKKIIRQEQEGYFQSEIAKLRREITLQLNRDYELRFNKEKELKNNMKEQLDEAKSDMIKLQSKLHRSQSSKMVRNENDNRLRREIDDLRKMNDELNRQLAEKEIDCKFRIEQIESENLRMAKRIVELEELEILFNRYRQEYDHGISIYQSLVKNATETSDEILLEEEVVVENDDDDANKLQSGTTTSFNELTTRSRSYKRKRLNDEEQDTLNDANDGFNPILSSTINRSVVNNSKFSSSQMAKSISTVVDSSCGVDIDDMDIDGDFIRIKNKTNDDIAIGQWSLKREANGETCTYHFKKNTILRALSVIAIWSFNTEIIHSPDMGIIKWKKERWPTGEKFDTFLYNSNGEIVVQYSMNCSEE